MLTLDIPQANKLESVRAVVLAAHRGSETFEQISDFTGFSLRHTRYRVHAARVLGFLRVEHDVVWVEPAGIQLLETEVRSDAERDVLYKAIESSQVMGVLAPDLLRPLCPSLGDLTERLFNETTLSRSTAERRANGLLAWRRYVMGQESMPKKRSPKGSRKKSEQLSLF